MSNLIHIGIDGGGTKSSLLALNNRMEPLFNYIDGPSNFLSIGIQKAATNIVNLFNKAALEHNIENASFQIVVGTAGAGRKEDAEYFTNALKIKLKEAHYDVTNLFVTSDAEIALEGAFNGNEGSLFISGTGSILFGKNTSKKIFRVGGFGRVLGDEGSGYSIGKSAIIAVAKYYDGQIAYSKLTDLIAEKFSVTTCNEIINLVYKENIDIASLAPLVLSAADDGDDVALSILESEIVDVVKLVKALKQKMEMEYMQMSFMGSLVANQNIYSRMLKDEIEKIYNIEVVKPKQIPEYGAILLGKRVFG